MRTIPTAVLLLLLSVAPVATVFPQSDGVAPAPGNAVRSGAERPAEASPADATVSVRDPGPGVWQGTISIRTIAPASAGGSGATSPAATTGRMLLTVLEDRRGALLDLPDQSMFGFPLSSFSFGPDRVLFDLDTGSGAPPLRFSGFVSRSRPDTATRIVGTFRGGEIEGTFMLGPAQDVSPPGETRLSIPSGPDRIPGTLLVPPGATGPVPLAVIFSASGTTDRNGNNFSIPGKNDSLRQLASGLASEGVATFRFDKRGSGEAYLLGRDESALRFDQYIQDGIAVLSRFADDPRFTRRMAIGHAEGGLVAAAAVNRIDDAETLLDALVLLCPTGKSPLATVEESLADTPGEHVREARAIMEALRRGARYPEPSEYFAGFFRPSFQGYLSSWFAYDPVAEVVAARIPVILVRGARDIHIREEDFRILADARPSASAFVVPGMNHALKEVSGDEDDNYDSFTDPDRKLGAGLVQLLAAIAHVRPVPATIRRFGR